MDRNYAEEKRKINMINGFRNVHEVIQIKDLESVSKYSLLRKELPPGDMGLAFDISESMWNKSRAEKTQPDLINDFRNTPEVLEFKNRESPSQNSLLKNQKMSFSRSELSWVAAMDESFCNSSKVEKTKPDLLKSVQYTSVAASPKDLEAAIDDNLLEEKSSSSKKPEELPGHVRGRALGSVLFRICLVLSLAFVLTYLLLMVLGHRIF